MLLRLEILKLSWLLLEVCEGFFFLKIASCLTNLLRKAIKFESIEKRASRFQELRQRLITVQS